MTMHNGILSSLDGTKLPTLQGYNYSLYYPTTTEYVGPHASHSMSAGATAGTAIGIAVGGAAIATGVALGIRYAQIAAGAAFSGGAFDTAAVTVGSTVVTVLRSVGTSLAEGVAESLI